MAYRTLSNYYPYPRGRGYGRTRSYTGSIKRVVKTALFLMSITIVLGIINGFDGGFSFQTFLGDVKEGAGNGAIAIFVASILYLRYA
ncbi:hypothetical protein [Halococcus sediminicola]|uniref:hypothetical protein n=1 Tax=Halococcus sediminicola TaxID=1264579 RepID=UPI0012AB4C36|nr:hypothetical protein [Halococcus sediminicola]